MKGSGTNTGLKAVALCALAAAWLARDAVAVAPKTLEDYQSIIARNPFGLRPPPPPQTNAPPPVVKPKDNAKIELFLTGITSVGYPAKPKRAYLMTTEQGKKDPSYYTFELYADGRVRPEDKDGIKVLGIDERSRKVKAIHNGEDLTLSFATHGRKSTAAAVPAPGAPGAPVVPGAPGQPQFPNMVPGQPGMTRVPGVPMVPGSNPGMQGVNGGVVADSNFDPQAALRPTVNGQIQGMGSRMGIPARQPRIQGVGSAGADPFGGGVQGGGEAPQVDPALQYFNLKVQEGAARQQNMAFPPIPTLH